MCTPVARLQRSVFSAEVPNPRLNAIWRAVSIPDTCAPLFGLRSANRRFRKPAPYIWRSCAELSANFLIRPTLRRIRRPSVCAPNIKSLALVNRIVVVLAVVRDHFLDVKGLVNLDWFCHCASLRFAAPVSARCGNVARLLTGFYLRNIALSLRAVLPICAFVRRIAWRHYKTVDKAIQGLYSLPINQRNGG